MCALYTFMRIADDLSDEQAPLPVKRQQLADWRGGLQQALQGHYPHPAHAALHDTVIEYRIPVRYLEAVIDGVEMDLEPIVYRTFDELRRYCYHVASVVGLSCIHIWGFHGGDAPRFRRGRRYRLSIDEHSTRSRRGRCARPCLSAAGGSGPFWLRRGTFAGADAMRRFRS